ncbi:hypothetical protein PENSPDRAFT_651591 [Peniophora sp. CONT]|nr:hypothetical protein PENSPDRAFT_651591 [Peniophora sp. CONT]
MPELIDTDTAINFWQNAAKERMASLPTVDSFDTEEKLMAAYELEISAANSAVAALQTQRDHQKALFRERQNARLPPIHRLPSELLGRIFHSTINTIQYRNLQAHSGHRYSHSLSHVCRRWRALALSMGTLWTTLHTDMPGAVWSVYLDRSQGSLIEIVGPWPRSPEVHSRAEDLVANFHRLKELGLGLHDNDMPIGPLHDNDMAIGALAYLRTALADNAPNLQNLSLGAGSGIGIWDPFLVDFIVHRAPALRVLYLNNIYFPWGASLPHLESLHLGMSTRGGQSRNPDASHTFDDVLRTLQSAPNLSNLVIIGDCVFTPPERSWTSETNINVPLRKLVLEGSMSRMGSILAVVKSNPQLMVRVHGRDAVQDPGQQAQWEDEIMDDMSTASAHASSTIHRHLSSCESGGTRELAALHLLVQRETVLMKLDSEVDRSLLDPYLASQNITHRRLVQIEIPLLFSWQARHESATASLRVMTLKLARSIPVDHFQHIRHLVLSGICWSADDIASNFISAHRVESLTVYTLHRTLLRDTASLVANLICTPPALGTSSANNNSLLLPELKTLHLIGFDFLEGTTHDGKEMLLSQALDYGVEQRHQRGIGLQVLRFGKCPHLRRSFVEKWRSMGAEVIETTDTPW